VPAVSEAQRRYLNARFGHAWVRKHGFDNRGKLPAHKRKKKQTAYRDALIRRLRGS
jgi:hypothetical protein